MGDLKFLKEAVSSSRHISCTELACSLGIHRNTLHLYMKHNSIERRYTPIGDSDLDDVVRECKKRHPNSGIRYIVGFMWTHGVHMQYRQVIQSIRRVDRLGQALRDHCMKTRCNYHVKRPNTLCVKSRSTPVGGPVKSRQKLTRAEGQRFSPGWSYDRLDSTTRTTSVDPLHRLRSSGDRDRDRQGDRSSDLDDFRLRSTG